MSGEATVTNLNDAVKLATKYGAAASRHAQKSKELGTANAALSEENAKLKTQLDELTKQLGTPAEKDQRIAQLETENRTFKHRSAFARQAKAAGVREDAIDDLFDALKLSVDGDPDDAKLTEALEGAKTAKPWAFGAAGDGGGGGQQQPQQREQKPIPGQSRGAEHKGGDATLITAEQRADPKFMLNPANQDAIYNAAKEGRFR